MLIFVLFEYNIISNIRIISMRKCAICQKSYVKKTVRKKLRGKYNPTTKQRKYPNLQWVKLLSGKRVKACTRCIKAMAKGK